MFKKSLSDLKPYPPGKPVEELKRELGLRKIYKMASNENFLGASKKAINAIKKELKKIHFYPEGGAPLLKRALSEKLSVKETQLILGNGTNEIIHILGETILSPGDKVVYAWPSFIVYRIISKITEAEAVEVPLKNFAHDLDSMAKEVDRKTKLVFVCNPNNPTGTIVTKNQLAEFLEKVKDKNSDTIVALDEAYFEYVQSPDYPDGLKFLREGYNVFVLRTFSKAYGLAGVRIGYGIGNEKLIQEMEKVRQPFNTNRLAQAAALAALKDTKHVEKTVKKTLKGKAYLYQALERMNVQFIESETNFILVKVGKAKEVFEKLLKKGVIVRPMDGYGLPEWIRVTVGSESANKTFIRELEKIL